MKIEVGSRTSINPIDSDYEHVVKEAPPRTPSRNENSDMKEPASNTTAEWK